MNKNHKIMFLMAMMTGTMISISSYSWFGMWMGLEINLMSMIPLMQEKKSMISIESSIKYFITQALASMILIASMIQMMKSASLSIENTLYSITLNSALLMKMGMAPFHFWFPEVMEGLSWMNCLIMMTLLKLAPMVLVMYNLSLTLFMQVIMVTGSIISSVMSFNQTSLRKLLTYSSINHMSWMMASMLTNQSIWVLYFSIYSMMTLNITMMMKFKSISSMNQLFSSLNSNPPMKLFFIMNFLNLSGIPPFLGFMPKWMTIEMMVTNDMNLAALSMILSTLMMIYMYLKISVSSMMMGMEYKSWNMTTSKNKSMMSSLTNFLTLSMTMVITVLINLT